MQRLVQMEPREQAGVFVMCRCWCEEGGAKTKPNDETLLLLLLLFCFSFNEHIYSVRSHCSYI